MCDVFKATITREQRITILVALSQRVDYLRERCHEDQSPEGLGMWPNELAAAQSAMAAIREAA